MRAVVIVEYDVAENVEGTIQEAIRELRKHLPITENTEPVRMYVAVKEAADAAIAALDLP